MILTQPDVNVLSSLKCDLSSLYSDKLKEEDYHIKLCKTSILEVLSVEERIKENYLKILLIENINFLNKINEYGKTIINCDLNKLLT